MKNINVLKILILIIMLLISFTNLFGISFAGISVIVGIFAFFIFKTIEKHSFAKDGFDIKSIGKDLKTQKIWLLILMPLIMNFVVIIIAKLVLPDYIPHLISRSAPMLSIDRLLVVIVQLAVFAVGEEIAWRAFFQKTLRSFTSVWPAILVSSVIFSFGHLTSGNTAIVVYDLFFVFVNSIFYGIVFEKTQNAWISAISHFIANMFAVIILFFL